VTLSVDIVIPTFRGWELTRSCLEHLRQQTVAHHVVVVDNGSDDGTPERLRTAFPEVDLIELGANRGFPIACNRGAEAGSGDVIVLLNNDVECPPGFLEALVRPLESYEIGSAAAVLVRAEGITIDSVGLTVDRTFAGFPRLCGRPVSEALTPAPALVGPIGAAGAYRREAWEQVCGLDEGVFIYGEDVDLALRLRGAGWKTALAHDAVAVHLGSASMRHRSAWQRYNGGFARGYFLRQYGVFRKRAGLRALATEAIVIVGDALISRDFVALRGRASGWRAGADAPRQRGPIGDAVDEGIGFIESLRLRRSVYAS
jgi:GT2 family glycosyltransferase